MTGLIGKKLGMSQVFADDGKVIPVTLIQAGPCPIVQIKTKDCDGYRAIQIGYGKKKRLTKAILNHIKKANLESVERLAEIQVDNPDKYKVGNLLDVSLFTVGDKVKVTGLTKGRGFSGGMKRWGWSGGPETHGSMSHRRTGSASSGSSPGRIWKNKTMPGHYGNEKVTVKNLSVVKIEKEKNIIYVKGAVPGSKSGILIITKEEK